MAASSYTSPALSTLGQQSSAVEEGMFWPRVQVSNVVTSSSHPHCKMALQARAASDVLFSPNWMRCCHDVPQLGESAAGLAGEDWAGQRGQTGITIENE